MLRKLESLFILLLILIAVYYLVLYVAKKIPQTSSPVATVTQTQHVVGTQTKTSGCQANGALPDTACTPGAANPTLTKDVICSSTFKTGNYRNVPTSEKRQVYDEYGITSHQPNEYEVDHLIPLEVGGANDIANLWPEAANPQPGFHQKDLVENYLKVQVCSGALSLQDAQTQIATNWLQLYNAIPDIKNYDYNKLHK